jgi:hypothetical protein
VTKITRLVEVSKDLQLSRLVRSSWPMNKVRDGMSAPEPSVNETSVHTKKCLRNLDAQRGPTHSTYIAILRDKHGELVRRKYYLQSHLQS